MMKKQAIILLDYFVKIIAGLFFFYFNLNLVFQKKMNFEERRRNSGKIILGEKRE